MWFKSNSELFDRNADGLTEPDLYSVNIYGTLYFRNGSKFQIDKGRVRRIVDRNGNFTQLAYCGEAQSACSGEMLLEKATDPVGRTTTFAYNCAAPAGQECHTITYSGYNGTSRVIKVTWGEATSKLRPDLASGTLFPDLNTTPLSQAGLSPLKVLLADGTSNYDIYYNRYGEVARIVLPTGGAYDYEYDKGFNNTESGIYTSGQVLSRLDDATNATAIPPWSPFIYRRLVKRREHLSVPPSGTLSSALDGLATGVTIYQTAETATGATYYSPIPTRVNGFIAYGSGSVTVTTFRCLPTTNCDEANRTVSRVRKHEFSVGGFDAGSSSTPRYGVLVQRENEGAFRTKGSSSALRAGIFKA
ncbi:MAG: hypothetical protein U0R19_02430 [Bryobacteraceae bacterium]